jgi:hypothetical protein
VQVTQVVDATAGRAAAALFAAASFLRRKRSLHPRGEAFHATFHVAPRGEPTGATLLDEPADRPCVVRISRGGGLPPPLPDVHGIAIHVPDAYGPGRHQDLLFATTAGRGTVTRSVLSPTRDADADTYSTILPFRVGTRTARLGARVVDAGFTVEVEGEPVAWVSLGERLPDDEAERLRFNPFTTGGGIEPVGVLNALRRRAYQASQDARPR